MTYAVISRPLFLLSLGPLATGHLADAAPPSSLEPPVCGGGTAAAAAARVGVDDAAIVTAHPLRRDAGKGSREAAS